MKKILLSFGLCSSVVFANGIHGFIGGIVGEYKAKDNFKYHKDNKVVNSLNSSPKEYDESVIYPSFNLKYKGYFVKTDIKDDFTVKAGYSWKKKNEVYLTPKGFGVTQDFDEKYMYKFNYAKEKMFVDPFAVGVERTTKKAVKYSFEAAAFSLYDIMDLTYKYKNTDIDDIVVSDLKQSGREHEIEAMFGVVEFNEESYGALGFIVGNGSYDGNSNDYTKAGIKYGMELKLNHVHNIEFETSYEKYDFDKVNSKFNKKRDEKSLSANLIYTKYNLLNNKKLFANAVAIYGKKDSNIHFYDKRFSAMMFNVGYTF